MTNKGKSAVVVAKVGVRFFPLYLRSGETIDNVLHRGRQTSRSRVVYSRELGFDQDMTFLHEVREYCHRVNAGEKFNAGSLDGLYARLVEK